MIYAAIEDNLHRDALHDLDVITGGIFGRQQTEARAARSRDRIDVTLVGFVGRIHVNVDPQAGLHLAKLRFLEIRGYPEIFFIERNDAHHLLPHLHVLPYFDRAVADRSADRRNHLGVLEIQFRLV